MLTNSEILYWLQEENEKHLQELWKRANQVRHEHVGDAVYLRGLVEISNYCVRLCRYCGLYVGNRTLKRYRLSESEIVQSAYDIQRLGMGTVVMQGGEDDGLEAQFIARVIRTIKSQTSLAVTLSLGERSFDELALWKEAGADRYLLRFETSDRPLYKQIHPSSKHNGMDRLDLLPMIRHLGYEVGSGVMIGIPGQTYQSLADDIALFQKLDLDMIGVGPYIVHPETPMGRSRANRLPYPDQVPNTELMTYKVVALTRLVCPLANLPATTALSTLNPEEGHKFALQRGANIVMPNLTPVQNRIHYEIYPGKSGVKISFQEHDALRLLTERIESIGRYVGSGPGSSPNYQRQQYAESL